MTPSTNLWHMCVHTHNQGVHTHIDTSHMCTSQKQKEYGTYFVPGLWRVPQKKHMEALSVFMGLTAPVKKTERRRMIIYTPGELPTEINPEGVPNKVVWSSLDVESVLAEVGQVDDVRRDRFSSDTREVALKMGWVCWDREGKTFGS